MNAAARLVHQHGLSRYLVLSYSVSRRQIATMLLAFAVISSALFTIYVTHLTRTLLASYQHHLLEQDHLHVEHGQLLLERSTWMVPARIQEIAEKRLGMIIPDHKSVVIIHE